MPDPLTPKEQALILLANSRGLSINHIRLTLREDGFRRGSDTIRTFLRDRGFAPNFERGVLVLQHLKPLNAHLHHCTFCEWQGDEANYYSHWQANHRTKAGWQRGDLRRRA